MFSRWSEESPTAIVLSDPEQPSAWQKRWPHHGRAEGHAGSRPGSKPRSCLSQGARGGMGEVGAIKPGGFQFTCSMRGLLFAQLQLFAKYKHFLRGSAFSPHPFLQET